MINLKFLEVNVIHVMLPVALSFHCFGLFLAGKEKKLSLCAQVSYLVEAVSLLSLELASSLQGSYLSAC